MNWNSNQPIVHSYMALRKAIGMIAVALPFVLAVGWAFRSGFGIERSISSYYHTGVRDIFVGALCAIGVFLWTYRGYDWRDELASNFAALCAFGVALFPTTPDFDPTSQEKVVGALHYGFAAALFGTLAYFCLALFTKKSAHPTHKKEQRNKVYVTCGIVILSCMALIAVIALLPAESPIKSYSPVFWLESAAIVAFGMSWLTKGEAILADEGLEVKPATVPS